MIDCGLWPRPGLKKTPGTEAIFANGRSANAASNADAKCLRLSIDTKANVASGGFSHRAGRGESKRRALDHDLATKERLVPGAFWR